MYIDRVVVDAARRRHGIGRRLYEDLITKVRGHAPVVTCEVNIDPPNPGSMSFHESQGFREIGQQDTEGGKKRVRLMARDL